MNSNDTLASHSPVNLIPDTCNVGILGRILAVELLVVALALFWRDGTWDRWVTDLSSATLWLVWVVLLSSGLLCRIRNIPAVTRQSPTLRRALCAIVPAMVIGISHWCVSQVEWAHLLFQSGGGWIGVIVAGFSGVLFQQAFEWRAKAYSPALDEARLQALQARIRPHFLFNSLNTALALIRRQPQQAERVIEDMSDLFRILMRDQRQLISLADEIQLCEQYLAIEALRLGERMRIHWEIQESVRQFADTQLIPPLIMQPLIENAVHYGVEPSVKGADVRIQITQGLDKLEIRISNPIQATVPLISGNHIALDNIRARLNLLYDIEADIRIDKANDVFQVYLFLPLRTYASTHHHRR